MSPNNFKQKVNKFLRKFANTDICFLTKFEQANFEADFLMKVKPEKCALRILLNEGTNF